MGGMHTWMWGVKYPGFMDALVPMASQPTEMSGRNWMMRRMLIEAIRTDPTYNDGNYTAQPRSLKLAANFYSFGTIGGNQRLQKLAPTRALADKMVDERMAAAFNADANDFLYQWDSSRDYNPSPGLEKIEAALLAINSADDERNPPELGIMEREMKRVKNGKLLIIPGSEETPGHGTTAFAKFWKQQFQEFLQAAPRKAS
jgi:homoserine O-acetyltransferase